MNAKFCFIILVTLLTTPVLLAQNPSSKKAPPPFHGDVKSEPTASELMERNFFEPELIMRHQNALGMTADQQKSIREEMLKTMPRFTELRWQQSAETEAMVSLFNQERPDEKEVLAQLEKLLGIENEIKRLHAGMLVRIRNALTPEQQARLREIKGKGGFGPKVPSKPQQ